MQYKKIKRNNVTLHLIKSNRFKTINIVLFFTKKFNKKDIPFGDILTHNMVYSSKKYNTKNKMAIKSEQLYGAKVSSYFGFTGDSESFTFVLDFVNPMYTDNKYLIESIDSLEDIIFNPNVENGEFNKEYFDNIKTEEVANINSIKINPGQFASIEYSKIMYKGTTSENSIIPTIEDLNKVTPSSLYDFYKGLFTGEYKIDIAVYGEVDDSIVDILFDKFGHIKSSTKKIKFKIDHKYDSKVVTKIDTLPFNQSKLYVGYRLLDMDFHELNHVMRVYNTILGTMNDSILFNIVREENSLCYSIGSFVSLYNPSLNIYAGINKTNYEKTIELIKKCVDSMSDKKVLERLFDSAKKTINTFLNNYYDDIVYQINSYYNREFETVEDIETTRENINKVTIDEVCKLNEKIKLSTIYFLKGDKE